MYARVIDATGWTWDYVGQCMTLPRLKAMMKRWALVPPVSESVALYLGITPTGTPSVSDGPPKPAPILDNASLWADVHTDPRTLTWESMPSG